MAAVDQAAASIDDPTFQTIAADPSAWLEADILRQRITALRLAIEAELTALSGISAGFNAADGD